MNLRHNLIEVKPETKEAVFQHLDTQETVKQLPNKPVVKTTIKVTVPYDLLHVTPPMSTPEPLASNASLADAAGFLDVNKETLQHNKLVLKHFISSNLIFIRFSNIFGLGDCTSVPTAKTAAAVAAQLGIIRFHIFLSFLLLAARNDS